MRTDITDTKFRTSPETSSLSGGRVDIAINNGFLGRVQAVGEREEGD